MSAFRMKPQRKATSRTPNGWALRIRHLDGVAHTLCHGLTRMQVERLAQGLNNGWLGEGGRAEAVEVVK